MTRNSNQNLIEYSKRIPMLKVFIADPYYKTNAVPSYVCAIDVETYPASSGLLDLSDASEVGFTHRMRLAFARALDTCLDCLIHADTRADIIKENFFNDWSACHVPKNTHLLEAIKCIAQAIDSKTNLYCNKLSFDVMQDGWVDTSPFDLEFRVEWVDAA